MQLELQLKIVNPVANLTLNRLFIGFAPTIFKAKPARKIIKARPVKAAKDAIA
jgi:hypothetical protein